MEEAWKKIKEEVVDSGLCTNCGTCVGLNNNVIELRETKTGPLPFKYNKGDIDPLTYFACPGKGVPYPILNKKFFMPPNDNFISGKVLDTWIGFSSDDNLRLNSASGGVITSSLLFLFKKGLINGAVVVKSGFPKPEDARPIIATTIDEIRGSAQSVYRPIPVNSILQKISDFKGNLAFVGLPDQVASIRMLQLAKHPSVRKIKYLLGPYTGTNMYKEAIRSFLRGRGVKDSIKISSLEWRAGEWPGYLEIKLDDGRSYKAEKFYYNYLTPFFITNSTLVAVDFTNELTDISVGDAWSPIFEKQGKGFSVVVSRTERGKKLLDEMKKENFVNLDKIESLKALNMHGHMLDFKKRGSFIRMDKNKKKGLRAPMYGYAPLEIDLSRRFVEKIVSSIFSIASKPISRKLSEKIPVSILGPIFNILRILWKKMSKPTKRKGLMNTKYLIKKDEIELLMEPLNKINID